MIINADTLIVAKTDLGLKSSVEYAIKALERDIKKKILSKDNSDHNYSNNKYTNNKYCNDIVSSIVLKDKALIPEVFELKAVDNKLCLYASSELGFIYGLYHISRVFLGILPFWFWNDQKISPVLDVTVPNDYSYTSRPFKVKYRGWFVNDEVLLDHFPINGDLNNTWKMVFEALMRLGGNMTIPGTDRNAEKFAGIALSMGLTITHHHAEPLGARMFKRVYPGKTASYDINKDLYHKLWDEAIEKQKDSRVIFNLGFRGQGDKPFWEDDPRYDTPKKRGDLITKLIRLQYDKVKDKCPDATCCTNLYGESMELYKKGYLDIPEDVILIWADNGFGKMVSRRQNNHNPRIPAMPLQEGGRHGIYYHASFYDLQAAAYLTPLTNQPLMVQKELEDVLDHGMNDFWLINCSNVKMHCFYLEFIANMWKSGREYSNCKEHIKTYAKNYYDEENYEKIVECIQGYFDAAISYGPNEDDHAGEQFPNHVTRMLITQFLKDRNSICENLLWATLEDTFKGQIKWFCSKCEEGMKSYSNLLSKCRQVIDSLDYTHAALLIKDRILMPGEVYFYSYEGAFHACRAMLEGIGGNYKEMFIEAGDSATSFDKAYKSLRGSEHDIWKGFYANDSECDLGLSKMLSEGLMRYSRIVGDGPSFYKWQRECTLDEGERDITLLLVLEAAFDDHKLYSMLKRSSKTKAICDA